MDKSFGIFKCIDVLDHCEQTIKYVYEKREELKRAHANNMLKTRKILDEDRSLLGWIKRVIFKIKPKECELEDIIDNWEEFDHGCICSTCNKIKKYMSEQLSKSLLIKDMCNKLLEDDTSSEIHLSPSDYFDIYFVDIEDVDNIIKERSNTNEY